MTQDLVELFLAKTDSALSMSARRKETETREWYVASKVAL